VKKLIISLSITLIIFCTLYFLIEENIIQLGDTRIKNLIGKNIESEYFKTTDLMEIGFKRFVNITDKKLDYIIEKIDIESLDKKGVSVLKNYFVSDQFCKRIRIVNQQYEIIYSTSNNDIYGSKLGQDIYGEIFDENRTSMSNIIIDPVIENIIFYRSFKGEQGDMHRVLFYYTQDILDSIFHQIESLNYRGFLISTDKIILINFLFYSPQN